MVRVICDCNVGFDGVRYPKGVPADLPEEVVASLGGRAVRLPVEPEPAPEKPKGGKAADKPKLADPVYLKPLAPEKPE